MADRLIGRYYVQLKKVHINWIHNTGPKRGKEAYLPIPAQYAYIFGILKGDIYTCKYLESGETVELKAAGTQSRRDYAKQFQGSKNLRILYDWYNCHDAVEGDYVVVSIYDNHHLTLEFVKQTQTERISALNIHGVNGKPKETLESADGENSGFRLLSLLVNNKERVICDYNFLSSNLKSQKMEPLTTLIIGANGTGKSFALKILSEIFLAVQNDNVGKMLPYDYYRLEYILDGNHIEIEIKNRAIVIHCNGMLSENDDTSLFPQKVLAIAFMLNDKFAFKADKSDQQSIYEYLGMRVTSNAAWTSSFENKIAENLIELAAEGKLWNILDKLPDYLQIDPKVSIACEISDGENFLDTVQKSSKNKLTQYITELGQKAIESESFRSDAVRKLTKKDYSEMAVFLKGLIELKPFVPNAKKKVFGFTFSTDDTQEKVQQVQADYKILRNLNNLRIIKNITLYLYKNGHGFSFDDSSSGEKHILYTVLNIARYLKNNSLVLIDEPEISLHPNWQMMYISFLKQLFKEYNSCHFILASHSPYLVSDLNPDSSSLVVLTTEQGLRSAQAVDYSTYAWSTENILYNVFHVRTTRNFYFDMDLRELLHKLDGNNVDKAQLLRIKELYQKLCSYVFDEHDPLNLILDEVKRYISNAESN